MMSIQNILISELDQAKNYFNRVFHLTRQSSFLSNNREIHETFISLRIKLETSIRTHFTSQSFRKIEDVNNSSICHIHLTINRLVDFLESLILISPIRNKKFIFEVSEYINLIYLHLKKVTDILYHSKASHLRPPKTGILKAMPNEDIQFKKERDDKKNKFSHLTLIEGDKEALKEEEEIRDLLPLYQLDISELSEQTKSKRVILGIKQKREERHDHFFKEGYNFVFEQKYPEAFKSFEKAIKYKETAESFRAIAWLNSILNKNELAKGQFLKAISIDPNYGPPYNDLGGVLLNEGKIGEAIKWFKLAKNTSKYENREFSYINLGKAYVMLKKYDCAIREFEEALVLSPDNQDLKETIQKLNQKLRNYKIPTDPDLFDIDNSPIK